MCNNDRTVVPTDVSPTLFADTTDTLCYDNAGALGKLGKLQRKTGIACNPLKHRVLSRKCRDRSWIARAAVIESLPLRHYLCNLSLARR